jgi:hypothetical protein
MFPLYLQTIGLVPAIIGENTAIADRHITTASASIESLRRRKRRQARTQNPGDRFSLAALEGC